MSPPASSPPRRAAAPLGRRLLLALGAGALALLVTEGIASLLGRPMLGRSRAATVMLNPSARVTDAERRQAAGGALVGLYQSHPDPAVGYVMAADAAGEILGAPFRTDALGLRVRPGPAPGPDTTRIAVIGDSVAFGYGIADDATLAHQLEALLRAAGLDVACWTVAVPGWNTRNAVTFLLDHLDVLDPDVVVHVPVNNDLVDTEGVLETGHRRAMPDPFQRDPLVAAHQGAGLRRARRLLESESLDDLRAARGTDALNDLASAESRRRFATSGDLIAGLARILRSRRATLLVLPYQDSAFAAHLFAAIDDAGGGEIPFRPLYVDVPHALTLGHDPHPNAEGAGVMAHWVAHELVERGLLPDVALPPAPETHAPRRAAARTSEAWHAESTAARALAIEGLAPVIDFVTLEGFGQVVGGYTVQGRCGHRLLAVLAPGATLSVTIEPIRDLRPLVVRVEADGQALGAIRLLGEAVTETFALPAREPADPHAGEGVEVKLVPARWIVVDDRGTARVASFTPVRLETRP